MKKTLFIVNLILLIVMSSCSIQEDDNTNSIEILENKNQDTESSYFIKDKDYLKGVMSLKQKSNILVTNSEPQMNKQTLSPLDIGYKGYEDCYVIIDTDAFIDWVNNNNAVGVNLCEIQIVHLSGDVCFVVDSTYYCSNDYLYLSRMTACQIEGLRYLMEKDPTEGIKIVCK